MTRDEAIKWLGSLTVDIGEMRHQDLWVYAQAITEIGQMIADTPDIVKCKDCRYFKSHGNTGYCDKATALLGELNPDNYCSYGERKDNE